MIEFAPGRFAHMLTITTGTDGRRWLFMGLELGFRLAPTKPPQAGHPMDSPPPELHVVMMDRRELAPRGPFSGQFEAKI